ncbi:MAG: trypsin-like peptidase domain-containing protein [Nevskiales bacterium]
MLAACQPSSEESQTAIPPSATAEPPAQSADAATPAPPAPSKADIVAQARNAVVLVRTPDTQGVGFIINPDGIVATSYQLIKGAKVIGVKVESGDIFPVTEIFAQDPLKNLALLRISGYKLPVLPLQDSTLAQAGQEVIIITDPAGSGTMISDTLATVADISELDKQRRGHRLMQMKAVLPPGSNGAPVLDMQGKVVGLAFSYGLGGQKQSVAIPSNYIAGLMNNPQPVALGVTEIAPAGSEAAAPADSPQASQTPTPASSPRTPEEKPPAPAAPRYTRSVREVQRIYVVLADRGRVHTDRRAGPGVCKPKVEEALQEEDFRIAASANKADVVLALSGTHETGCTRLGCGREIMLYHARLTNKDGDAIWQMSGNENATSFNEVCKDMAEDIAEALDEARDR